MCYRTGKYTVCRRVRASFSPEILQARAVMGLIVMEICKAPTQRLQALSHGDIWVDSAVSLPDMLQYRNILNDARAFATSCSHSASLIKLTIYGFSGGGFNLFSFLGFWSHAVTPLLSLWFAKQAEPQLKAATEGSLPLLRASGKLENIITTNSGVASKLEITRLLPLLECFRWFCAFR